MYPSYDTDKEPAILGIQGPPLVPGPFSRGKEEDPLQCRFSAALFTVKTCDQEYNRGSWGARKIHVGSHRGTRPWRELKRVAKGNGIAKRVFSFLHRKQKLLPVCSNVMQCVSSGATIYIARVRPAAQTAKIAGTTATMRQVPDLKKSLPSFLSARLLTAQCIFVRLYAPSH